MYPDSIISLKCGVEFEFVYRPTLNNKSNSYNLPKAAVPALYTNFLSREGVKQVEKCVKEDYKSQYTFMDYLLEPFTSDKSRIEDVIDIGGYETILDAVASEYDALDDIYEPIVIKYNKKYKNQDVFMEDLYSLAIDERAMKTLLNKMESNLYTLSGLDTEYEVHINSQLSAEGFIKEFITAKFGLDIDKFIDTYKLQRYVKTFTNTTDNDIGFARSIAYSALKTDMAEMFKGTPLSSYAIVDSTYANSDRRFIVKNDGSIQTNSDKEIGIEISTPALPFEECLLTIKKMFEYISEHGDTNQSCGFHINLSFAQDDKFNDIDWVKLAMFLYDPYILNYFGRGDNRYTSSQYKNMMATITNHISDIYGYIKEVSNGIKLGNYDIRGTINALSRDKYTSINIKSNYIEFRIAGGKYHDKYNTIVNLIYRYCACMMIATNPLSYKQDYIKKLYKYSNIQQDIKIELKHILQSLPDFNMQYYINTHTTLQSIPVPIKRFLDKYYTFILGLTAYEDKKKVPVDMNASNDDKLKQDALKLNFLAWLIE